MSTGSVKVINGDNVAEPSSSCLMHDSKSRDELLKQGIVTLLGKPVDGEDGGLPSQ